MTEGNKHETDLGWVTKHTLDWLVEGNFLVKKQAYRRSTDAYVIVGQNWSGDSTKLANKLHNARYVFFIHGEMSPTMDMLISLIRYGRYGDLVYTEKPKILDAKVKGRKF